MSGAIRITQIDGTLPNLALMRLAQHHRDRGDRVHFTRRVRRDLFEPAYDLVYGSAIFQYSAARVARLRAEWPAAVIGGTGAGDPVTVEQVVGDAGGLDYSIYPDFKASLGFTQRGCRLKCKFCVVPEKEGKNRAVASVGEIWRGAPWPRNLHLLDNDFFGQPEADWQARIAEIRDGGFRVCLTQGINVRLITEAAAAALASIEYRDGNFRRRRVYTAWDNLKDERIFYRGIDRLEAAGVPARRVMAYMLIGFDPAETFEQIMYRFERMTARAIRPYPMVFDPARKDLKAFQRWAVTGLYRAVPWADYRVSAKAPADPLARRENLVML